MAKEITDWNAAAVCAWLDSRIVAARADQVSAQRGGRERQDDCDAASAEELVCTAVRGREGDPICLLTELKAVLDRDDYIWPGVYDDRRFDRHVRTYARKLIRMTKANEHFENLRHHQ